MGSWREFKGKKTPPQPGFDAFLRDVIFPTKFRSETNLFSCQTWKYYATEMYSTVNDGGPLGKGAVGESRREWRRRQQSCAQEREPLGAQGPPPHAAGQERERQVHLYGNGGWIAALSGTSRASPSLLALRLVGPIPRLCWGGPRAPLRGPRARLGIPRTARSSLRRGGPLPPPPRPPRSPSGSFSILMFRTASSKLKFRRREW